MLVNSSLVVPTVQAENHLGLENVWNRHAKYGEMSDASIAAMYSRDFCQIPHKTTFTTRSIPRIKTYRLCLSQALHLKLVFFFAEGQAKFHSDV